MIQGAAEAGAAAVALQLLRVATFMAALTEARLTEVAAGSAPEVAPEVVVVMLAGLRGIEADAVEPTDWRTCGGPRCWNSPLSYWRLHESPRMLTTTLRNDLMTGTI